MFRTGTVKSILDAWGIVFRQIGYQRLLSLRITLF